MTETTPQSRFLPVPLAVYAETMRSGWADPSGPQAELVLEAVIDDAAVYRNTDERCLRLHELLRVICGRDPTAIRDALRTIGRQPSYPRDMYDSTYTSMAGVEVPDCGFPVVTLQYASRVYDKLIDRGDPPLPKTRQYRLERALQVVRAIDELNAPGSTLTPADVLLPYLPSRDGYVWIWPNDEYELTKTSARIEPAILWQAVGKPALPEDGNDDYVVAAIMATPRDGAGRPCRVPSVLDSRGYPWFLPGRRAGPRSGTTVNLSDMSSPHDGVPEWTRSSYMEMSELRLETFGPLSVTHECEFTDTLAEAYLKLRASRHVGYT